MVLFNIYSIINMVHSWELIKYAYIFYNLLLITYYNYVF